MKLSKKLFLLLFVSFTAKSNIERYFNFLKSQTHLTLSDQFAVAFLKEDASSCNKALVQMRNILKEVLVNDGIYQEALKNYILERLLDLKTLELLGYARDYKLDTPEELQVKVHKVNDSMYLGVFVREVLDKPNRNKDISRFDILKEKTLLKFIKNLIDSGVEHNILAVCLKEYIEFLKDIDNSNDSIQKKITKISNKKISFKEKAVELFLKK